MTECERYLGFPMAMGKLKVNTFEDLQEKSPKGSWDGRKKLYQRQEEKFLSKRWPKRYLNTP